MIKTCSRKNNGHIDYPAEHVLGAKLIESVKMQDRLQEESYSRPSQAGIKRICIMEWRRFLKIAIPH
jgi:hypothetical protein